MALSKFKRIQARTIPSTATSFSHDILSGNKVTGYSVNFPIGSTCQPSKLCADTCYGLKGPITWSSALGKQAKNLAWCKQDPQSFVDKLELECRKLISRDQEFYLRWNGVGDLFQQSVDALVALNQRLPDMPIWCVTRIPRFATQLANIENIWVHFSLDRSSLDRHHQMSDHLLDMKNLFFSYQCEPSEVLEELSVNVGVLFFDGYKIKEANQAWADSPITCPLNLQTDISGTCAKCRRCFNGKAVELNENERAAS